MMPTYSFTTELGETVERFMSVAQYERKVRDGVMVEDGVVLTRNLVADLPGGHLPSCWPMTSTAAGVHPDEIKKYKDEAACAGVSVDFTRDGDAIFRDRKHRKDCLKLWGMRDRNGGYGD